MSKLKIAILGSNGHIARGLIERFRRQGRYSLNLFTRSPESLLEFLGQIDFPPGRHCSIKEGYEDFHKERHEVIINCIGAGSPNKLNGRFTDWFTVTEQFDNLALDYLRRKADTLYIHFSSGAVYGRNLQGAVHSGSLHSIPVNQISVPEFYAIAKLNAEAKHRAFVNLNIVDIRIFSYFSRFIDLDSGYFITDILQCLLRQTPLVTNKLNIIRDYPHPEDLFRLVNLCIEKRLLNTALDAYSAKPCDKNAIIAYFRDTHGLQTCLTDTADNASPNGLNIVYCSMYDRAKTLLGYHPGHSSLETINQESRHILSGKKIYEQLKSHIR